MKLVRTLKDRISIYDHNENLIAENQIASVQGGNTIITSDAKYPIDIGYFITRKTSAGVEEKYEVIDPNYNAGLRSIPAHYQMKVRNMKAQSADPISSNITNINLHGNSRFYQDSVDNSNNSYVQSDPAYEKLLTQIKLDILDLDLEESEQILVSKVVDKIASEVKNSEPNKDKIKAFITMFPAAVTTLESVINLSQMTGL